MSAITAADIAAALKPMYGSQGQKSLVFDKKARPFLSMLKTIEEFEGQYYPLPVLYEDSLGGSNTFTTAQTNVGAPGMETFQVDPTSNYYRIVQISTQALRRAKSSLGSFITQTKLKYDSALNGLANDIETSLFRSADGHLATISGAPAAGVVTLSNAGDAKLFAIGEKLVCANSITAALHTGEVGTVTATDPVAGTITVSGTITNWGDTDVIFRQGDYVSASDTLHLHGLADWIPTSLESGTFMGVTRTGKREKLAGMYFSDGSLTDIEYSMFTALCQMGDRSAAPVDKILTDYTLWGLLAKELGIEVSRDPRDGDAGMTRIGIAHPNGVAEVVPCTKCQPNTAWPLTSEDWVLVSLGPAAGIFDDDGQLAQRISNADGIETRAVGFPELGCSAPVRSGRIAFS